MVYTMEGEGEEGENRLKRRKAKEQGRGTVGERRGGKEMRG